MYPKVFFLLIKLYYQELKSFTNFYCFLHQIIAALAIVAAVQAKPFGGLGLGSGIGLGGLGGIGAGTLYNHLNISAKQMNTKKKENSWQ